MLLCSLSLKTNAEKLQLSQSHRIVVDKAKEINYSVIISQTFEHCVFLENRFLIRLWIFADYIEKKASALGLEMLFLLTTRTADWFVRRGFEECSIEMIPEARRERINLSRRSKYYMKKLLPDRSGISVVRTFQYGSWNLERSSSRRRRWSKHTKHSKCKNVIYYLFITIRVGVYSISTNQQKPSSKHFDSLAFN